MNKKMETKGLLTLADIVSKLNKRKKIIDLGKELTAQGVGKIIKEIERSGKTDLANVVSTKNRKKMYAKGLVNKLESHIVSAEKKRIRKKERDEKKKQDKLKEKIEDAANKVAEPKEDNMQSGMEKYVVSEEKKKREKDLVEQITDKANASSSEVSEKEIVVAETFTKEEAPSQSNDSPSIYESVGEVIAKKEEKISGATVVKLYAEVNSNKKEATWKTYALFMVIGGLCCAGLCFLGILLKNGGL